MFLGSRQEKSEKLNAFLFCACIFMPIILTPVKVYMESGVSIWIAFFLMFMISAVVNANKRISVTFVVFVIIIFVYFLISVIVADDQAITIGIFGEFLRSTLVVLFLFQFVRLDEFLVRSAHKFAVVALLVTISTMPYVISGDVGYMSFGGLMATSLIFIYFKGEVVGFKVFDVILIFLGLSLVLVFANRMSFVVVALSMAAVRFANLQGGLLSKLFYVLLFFALIFVLILYFEPMLLYVDSWLDVFGIESYSIDKLLVMVDSGVAFSSSGRDYIYTEAISIIADGGFLPHAPGYYEGKNTAGLNYPHNLVIDLFLVVGLPGFVIYCLFNAVFLTRVLSMKNVLAQSFVLMFFVFSIVRLSTSGTFWTEYSFWLPYFVYMKYAEEAREGVRGVF